jgi:hypothetical protein
VINVLSIESGGRFLKHDALSRIANGESPLDIDPNELLEPVTIEHQPAVAEPKEASADDIPLRLLEEIRQFG